MRPIQNFPDFHIVRYAKTISNWVSCCHSVLHFAEKLLMNDVSQSIQYMEHSLIAYLNAIFAVPMNEEAPESAHRSWCNICVLLSALETQF